MGKYFPDRFYRFKNQMTEGRVPVLGRKGSCGKCGATECDTVVRLLAGHRAGKKTAPTGI